MGHVFLSYHRPNLAKAKRVVAALGSAGYDVWWDDQLPTHRTFYEVIDERLRAAEAVVVLWSKEAPHSDWVRAEADLARTLGKLVQASTDGEMPPMPFNQIQCAQLDRWNGNLDHVEWVKVLDGVRAVAGRPATTTIAAPPRRRLAAITAGAALLIGVVAAAGYWMSDRSTPGAVAPGATTDTSELPVPPRIAVLPFEPIGRDPQAADFAAALADIVAGSLSENFVQTLPVARAGEFEGDHHAAALKAIGANLALGGSVRNADGHISVRAYFEDVASGFTVWSAQFRRSANAEALLLSEVAAAVTETAHTVGELQQPDMRLDLQTLSLYLKLIEKMETPGASTGAQAMALAEQVVVRSPTFAEAHGTLALLLAESSTAADSNGATYDENAARLKRAHREADQAISLYAASGSAYDALYLLARLETPTDLMAAEAQLLRGLNAAPTFAFVQMRRCEFLLAVGRISESLRRCDQAAAIRPLSPPPVFRRALALWYDGQIELAQHALAEAAVRHPNSFWVNVLRFSILVNVGREAEAAAMLEDPAQRPVGLSPEGVAAAQAYFKAVATGGAPADVEAAVRALSRAATVGVSNLLYASDLWYASALASRLGKVDEALDWLARLDPNSLVDSMQLFNPSLERVRRDPRFMALAARAGLIDYWRKTGTWPDFCADTAWPYDCRIEAGKALPDAG
jgi:TolB-like protein